MKDFVKTIIEEIQKMDEIDELIHIESAVGRIGYPHYEISKTSALIMDKNKRRSKYRLEIKYATSILEIYKIEGSIKHIIKRIKTIFLREENN